MTTEHENRIHQLERQVYELAALQDEVERLQRELRIERGQAGNAAFKNFHRLLCERFGYWHDELYWWRDLLSLEEHIAAQLSSQQVKVPEGWHLVPKEPTDAMVERGCSQHVCEQGDPWYSEPELSDTDCKRIYVAMLSAAPAEGSDTK